MWYNSKDGKRNMIITDLKLKNLKVHIKIDSGMNRLGFNNNKDLIKAINLLKRYNFILEGIFFDNIYSNGEYENEISMGILRSDYNECERINFIDLYSEDIELKLLTLEDAEALLDYYVRNKDYC